MKSARATGKTFLAGFSAGIAGELRKLAEAGALKEPGDLSFFASVIRTFEATFLPEGPRNRPRQIIPKRILSPAGVPNSNR
jgi:hypothetical protein